MMHLEALLPPMKWNAWGDPAAAKPLSEGIRSLLKQAVGLQDSGQVELGADEVRLRPSTLSEADREALARIVGALDPTRGEFGAVVSLDLRRFDQLIELDEVSGEDVFGAGVTGPDAERLLNERGFSLGHFPQSFEYATIGGFAATRSSGQDSA